MANTNVANMEGGNQGALAKAAALPVRIKEYIDDLKAEMTKVTWPNWKQVRATTAVVIASVFGFAFYFMLVDVLLGRTIQKVFDTFAK